MRQKPFPLRFDLAPGEVEEIELCMELMLKASSREVVLLRLKPREKLGHGRERNSGDVCLRALPGQHQYGAAPRSWRSTAP